jgi:iron complex transport system permease protein
VLTRKAVVLTGLAVLAVVVIAFGAAIGGRFISVLKVLGSTLPPMESEIFWKIRVPRVCTAFLAGSGLALSGMAFQALFRNALAEPFTLGVASGASFGAALYVRFGIPFVVLGVSGTSMSAFLGAALAISLVYGLSKARKGLSAASMLLAGVAVSYSFSSAILFTQYVSSPTHSLQILRWVMGGLEVVGFRTVLDMLPFVLIGSAVIVYLTHELNLLSTGEDLATSRGVDVKRVKRLLFLATSLMVGGIVSFCGPIGFVGLMAPHMCRLVIGSDHRYLAPASILFGGIFLTLCDMAARVVIAPAEIPVGVVTALLGGPFFLWLLLAGSSERSIA